MKANVLKKLVVVKSDGNASPALKIASTRTGV